MSRACDAANARYPAWIDQDRDKAGYHAFIAGASWLAEELVSDEAVEAGAAGMWDRHGKPGLFHHAPDHYREAFRRDARAALTAALEAVK